MIDRRWNRNSATTVERYHNNYSYGGPFEETFDNSAFLPAKYNGKEYDEVHGLNWYDYGARMYDPAMARFTQMDPLCELYPHLSQYAYCAGNPVRYVDLDGMRPSRKEALAMAEDVYTPGKKKLPGGWSWIDPNSQEWDITLNDESSGLLSALYSRTNKDGTTEYTLATAGTNPFSINDWEQNLKQFSGISDQYSQSVNNAEKLVSFLGEKEITFVGHSLGGGIASANALKTGKDAITFNAAGLSPLTKRKLELSKSANITAYVVRDEAVNCIQSAIGLKAEGNINYLPSIPLQSLPPFARPAASIAYHTIAYIKLVSNLMKDK